MESFREEIRRKAVAQKASACIDRLPPTQYAKEYMSREPDTYCHQPNPSWSTMPWKPPRFAILEFWKIWRKYPGEGPTTERVVYLFMWRFECKIGWPEPR